MKPHEQDLMEAVSLCNALAPEARGTSGDLKDAYEHAKKKAAKAAAEYLAVETLPSTKREGT